MPQQIIMNEPLQDIEKLRDMLNTLLTFGMIHEDRDNDIAEAMLLWTTKQEELTHTLKEEMERDELEGELIDYITDNYGQYHFVDLISEISDKDLQKKSALMFRHIIFNIMNQDMYQDSETVVEECEEYLNEEL